MIPGGDGLVVTRTIRCTLGEGGSLPAELPTEQRDRTPWIDRWTFERGGKRWRVAVVPYGPVQEHPMPYLAPEGRRVNVLGAGYPAGHGLGAVTPVQSPALPLVRLREVLPLVDSRDWIESLGDRERWPEGTTFELVIEEVTP